MMISYRSTEVRKHLYLTQVWTSAHCRSGNANILSVKRCCGTEPSIHHKGQSLSQPEHLKGSEYFREELRHPDSSKDQQMHSGTHKGAQAGTVLKHIFEVLAPYFSYLFMPLHTCSKCWTYRELICSSHQLYRALKVTFSLLFSFLTYSLLFWFTLTAL